MGKHHLQRSIQPPWKIEMIPLKPHPGWGETSVKQQVLPNLSSFWGSVKRDNPSMYYLHTKIYIYIYVYMVNLFKCQISIYIICKDPPNMLWLTCVLPLHSFTATYWMYKSSCTCFYLPKNFLAWCYFTLRGLYQIILLQHPIISSTKKTLALLHFWMPKLTSQRKKSSIWMFPKIGVPQNGWFVMENLIKMDDLGAPLLSPIVGNTMKDPHSSWKLSLWPTSTGHFNDAADSFRDDGWWWKATSSACRPLWAPWSSAFPVKGSDWKKSEVNDTPQKK